METQNQVVNNFERTRPSSNKVTCGFKCSPQVKVRLNNASLESNISLSEYCEMVVTNYLDGQTMQDNSSELVEKIEFYENKTLKRIFEKHKGETISFVNADGCPLSIKMNSVQDAYTILINSFKTQNND